MEERARQQQLEELAAQLPAGYVTSATAVQRLEHLALYQRYCALSLDDSVLH